MSLSDVIESLATDDDVNGVYVVTRRPSKVLGPDGIFVAQPSKTFPITAVREPATGMQRVVGGRDMLANEQGQTVTDVQVIISTTPLFTRVSMGNFNPLFDPDLVTMFGGTYEVFRVERWELDDDTHYRAVCSRLNAGAA